MAKQQEGPKAHGRAGGDDRDLDDIETEIDEALEDVDDEEVDERLDEAIEQADDKDPDEVLIDLEEDEEPAGEAGEDEAPDKAGSSRK